MQPSLAPIVAHQAAHARFARIRSLVFISRERPCREGARKTGALSGTQLRARRLTVGCTAGPEVANRHEEGGPPCWQVDLGDAVSKAIKRNCQAFAVAEALGRVSKSSMLCYPHFSDIEFRRQLLLFFLEEGCQPPRMMLSVAKGLPKY